MCQTLASFSVCSRSSHIADKNKQEFGAELLYFSDYILRNNQGLTQALLVDELIEVGSDEVERHKTRGVEKSMGEDCIPYAVVKHHDDTESHA